jgi:uncharacterized RDD family membrane protein YckC
LPFRGGQAFQSGDWGYGIYLLAVAFLFFGWFWTRDGQTLGMRAWKIRLTSAHGGTIAWQQAALRFVPGLLCLGLFMLGASLWPEAENWIALLSFGLLVLGFCWALLDRDKRCWHDIIANTRMAGLSDAKNQATKFIKETGQFNLRTEQANFLAAIKAKWGNRVEFRVRDARGMISKDYLEWFSHEAARRNLFCINEAESATLEFLETFHKQGILAKRVAEEGYDGWFYTFK